MNNFWPTDSKWECHAGHFLESRPPKGTEQLGGGPHFACLAFIPLAYGKDVMTRAVAATLGHDAAFRMEANIAEWINESTAARGPGFSTIRLLSEEIKRINSSGYKPVFFWRGGVRGLSYMQLEPKCKYTLTLILKSNFLRSTCMIQHQRTCSTAPHLSCNRLNAALCGASHRLFPFPSQPFLWLAITGSSGLGFLSEGFSGSPI